MSQQHANGQGPNGQIPSGQNLNRQNPNSQNSNGHGQYAQGPNGHGHSTYSFLDETSTNPNSESVSSGLPQTTLSPSHTLPSLNTYYGSRPATYASYRVNPSSMLITSQAEAAGQPGTFPVYAPTGGLYFQGYPEHNSPLTPQHQQLIQSSRPPSVPQQPLPQAPSPYHPTSRSLPEILPMPPRTNRNTAPSIEVEKSDIREEEEKSPKSHVVGAQGRRGILPCADGCPPALVGTNPDEQTTAVAPPQPVDGKFLCVHCNKKYLHSKHLKRHLLRHSGIRPYACGLCHDTFSRSDILKRHFNKCSFRRGNPTGQSHLAHSRASKKAKERQEPLSGRRDMLAARRATPTAAGHDRMSNYPTPTMEAPASIEFSNLSLDQSNYGGASNQVSRANSVSRSTGGHSNRASLGMISASGYESAGYAHSTGHVTPDSVTTSGAATPYTYPHESRTSQFSENGALCPPSSGDPTSSNYNHAPFPHIVGQDHGRGYHMSWPQYPQYNTHDEYTIGQSHSGINTPLEGDNKPDDDFPNLPMDTFYPGNRRR